VRAIGLLLGKDARLLRRAPALAVALLVYPLVVALLVGLVVRYAGERPRVALVAPEGLPSVIVVGKQTFDLQQLFDQAKEVKLVRMPAARADHQLASGQVLAILTVPKGFTSELRGLKRSPKLILRTTRGGLSTRVVEKLRSFVYSTNLDLQKAYIEANLSAVDLLLRGGDGLIGSTRFSLLGIHRARAELAQLSRSPDPAVARRARELGTFMNQLNGAVGQVGAFLQATANPIQLVHVSQGGRSWILSAQVQAYALALALAFVAVLLGAGAIVAEREENVLGRLVGGLVGFGRLVAEKIAFVTLIAAGLGLLLALAFGLIVELGHVSGGQPWQRLPLLLAGLLLAAAAFGAFGVLVGALAREAGTATLFAFLVALPLTLVSLVPHGTAPVVEWIGAVFPFGHAVHAFTVALYDTHPAGLFLRECLWLAALALAYGLAARAAARRLL
jgi:hypothetical protein